MGAMAHRITRLTIVYSTVHSVADQRKHVSSASLAFVRGIHRWPVNSPHKWPVLLVKTSTNQNVANQNVDKPKRRHTETSTNQNVDKPKRRQTETSTNLNVDRPKRRQTKTSTI